MLTSWLLVMFLFNGNVTLTYADDVGTCMAGRAAVMTASGSNVMEAICTPSGSGAANPSPTTLVLFQRNGNVSTIVLDDATACTGASAGIAMTGFGTVRNSICLNTKAPSVSGEPAW